MSKNRPTPEEKRQRYESGQMALCLLDDEGFQVLQLSEYHYRVNSYWDFWPTSKKWYNISTFRKGTGTESLIKAIHEMREKNQIHNS